VAPEGKGGEAVSLDHLDGPTLLVTKLPDGSMAWTVIRPRSMEISSHYGGGITLKIEGRVLTGDWRYGPPPADWEEQATGELPASRPAIGPEVKRLPSSGPR
jgi:hypothetical protein